MSLGNLIYSALAGVDENYTVYPVFAPQEAAPPWITYRIDQSSDQDEFSYQIGGAMNPYWSTFYTTVWSMSYAESDKLATTILTHLHSVRSIQGFQQIQFMGRTDLGDPELILFGVELKFRGYTTEV